MRDVRNEGYEKIYQETYEDSVGFSQRTTPVTHSSSEQRLLGVAGINLLSVEAMSWSTGIME